MSKELKKVIVTGCSGMDGSNMVDYLLRNTDHLIYGMVRRSANPNYSNIEHAFTNLRFKLVTGDLGDSQSIDNLVNEIKPDYFINFAAQSFVGISWQIPEQTFDAGAMGVLRCLEAVRKHAPLCRFYNAGSSEEFGDVEYSPQDENHPMRPQSVYGAAKSAARQLVRVYRQSYNLYAIQGHLFNHEGVRRGEEFVTRKITKGVARIYHAFKNCQLFEPIELGNLDAMRDWSDSEDFVDGVWRMLNQDIYSTPIRAKIAASVDSYEKYTNDDLIKDIKEYVLSSDETHSVREFIELSFKEAGIDGDWNGVGKYEYFYSPHILGSDFAHTKLVTINPKFYRPAEVKLLHGNSKAVREDLGWKPNVTFPELVKRMVQNDIENYEE